MLQTEIPVNVNFKFGLYVYLHQILVNNYPDQDME